MKYFSILLLGLVMACNTSQKPVKSPVVAKTADPVVLASTITEDELKEHLMIYASDEYEGRETGKPGQKKAVEYIKSAYEGLEVPAAQAGGSYFQKVPLELTKLPTGTLTFNGKDYENGLDFVSLSKALGTYPEIISVGYGIEAASYSDYNGVDVNGKVVLVKAGEPKNTDGTFTISGTSDASSWGNMSEGIGLKSELAQDKGAKGVLYYDPDNYLRFKGYYDYMKANDRGQMQIKAPEDSPFLILLGNDLAQTIFPNISDTSEKNTITTSITFNLKSENETVDSENVVAVIKGNTYPDEYIVISSHLDHIGVNADGQINNGADDDGSGTVAMLEIAEAFKEAQLKGSGPKRSVVFLHVTGEEKGLLGSRYYTDEAPIFPLEQTVANLNIDMIGRIDPKRDGGRNYVYLIGSDKLSTELHNLSESMNDKYANLELDYTYNDENDPNRFYYRSDHYNFAKNNIPIIFYFSGTHEDYHRPGDTPDKINYDLLQNRARLIFHTAWELANREQRVVVDKMTK